MEQSIVFTVTIEREQGERIKKEFAKLGFTSESELIRTAVREYFKREDFKILTGDSARIR